MSDFDPDAYLTQGTSAAAPPFDPDAYLSQPSQPAVAVAARTPPTATQHAADVFGIIRRHPFMAPTGLAENALSGVTGGVGSLADALTGSDPGTHDYAYRPRTEAGKAIAAASADEAAAVGRGYDAVVGTGPLAQTLKERVPEALGAISTVTGLAETPKVVGGIAKTTSGLAQIPKLFKEPLDVQAAMDAAASNSPQSMGAAAAAQRINLLSPAMRQGFRDAVQKTGGAVNPEAAVNHAEADAHGVQLMEGQATRDPAQFSREQNSTHPDIVKRINDQNTQMTEALDEIRREASPGAVQNSPIDNGQIAVDSLKAYDEPVQADIRAKYKALTDANGGSVPIDPGTFLGKVDTALKKNYLTNSVPPAAAELLNGVRNGEPLDFEGFEAARTRLAEAQREGGSAGQAARIIRGELEQLPLSPAGAHLKGLADTARAAAKARFDELDADPAYQAAVDDVSNGVRRGEPSALADRFLDKYALGTAPKANVDRMTAKLDPEAQQAVAAHTLSTIRKSAIPASGTITPTGLNNALAKYGPKLDSLISPESQEALESLGRVVSNAKTPPPGHFVNYSKSGVIINAAQGVGEAALNAKTFGIGAPIIKKLSEGSWAKQTLKPGAGLDKLTTRSPP
jgi:hypothetical protein